MAISRVRQMAQPKASEKEPIEITLAPEAEQIARDLIREHHPHLQDEEEVSILYLFTTQKRAVRGKQSWAWTAKLSPLQRFLSSGKEAIAYGESFVIQFSLYVWGALTEAQKRALVDHELTHCTVNDKGVATLAPHDLEEFSEIVSRHGLWSSDVRAFANVVGEQLALFGERGARE